MERKAAAYWVAWAAIIAVAAYFRFWQVGMQIVIDDEWHAINKLKSSGYLDILLSFGLADHSIPLTVYYKFLADTIGLTEWGLRLPMLVCGMLAVVLAPWLLRRWLSPIEQLGSGALLAISPVLIHFSRTGRPYAITVLLCLVALVAFYRWWNTTGKKQAFAYVTCTAIAAWLHPVTLAITFGGLLWGGTLSLEDVYRNKSGDSLKRVSKIALAALALCGLLLGPPLWNDYANLAAKAGADHVEVETLVVAWELLMGTGSGIVGLIGLGVALFGAYELYRRDSRFTGYIVFIMVIAAFLIIISGASWIHHGRLALRYWLPLVPFTLVFIAAGVAGIGARISRFGRREPVQAVSTTAAVIALYFLGPLPVIYQGINQFTGHLSYQFDYNYKRSVYQQYLSAVEIPIIYYRIAEAGLGTGWEIIETPWRLESHFNPLYLYQQVHQLPIRVGFMSGLCAEPFYGEYGIDKAGLQFNNFVHLKEILADRGQRRFVIFHLKPARSGMRQIPGVVPCLKKFRARFGKPWFESNRVAVYRFGPRDDDT